MFGLLVFYGKLFTKSIEKCVLEFEYLLWSGDFRTGSRARIFCWPVSYDQIETERQRPSLEV